MWFRMAIFYTSGLMCKISPSYRGTRALFAFAFVALRPVLCEGAFYLRSLPYGEPIECGHGLRCDALGQRHVPRLGSIALPLS